MAKATGSTGDLIKLLGPEAAAKLARPLTHAEDQMVAEALARHGGDPVAAMGADVDAGTAAFIRSLPVGR